MTGVIGRPVEMTPGRALQAFARFVEENGYAPSVREIAAALGYSSTQTGVRWLRHLEEFGYIEAPVLRPRARGQRLGWRTYRITAFGREMLDVFRRRGAR